MEGLTPYPEYRESDHPWIDKIPAHWEEKRAKYLFREVDERSVTGDEELLSVSHITGVTPRSQKNINMFLAESYIGSKLCQEGDLVINTMWAWMAALGVAKQSGIVSPSYGVYRPKSRDIFVNDYVDYLLRIKPYASEYFCRSTGIRSSRLRLYPESFLQIPILCPSYEEQILIVKFLRWINFQVRNYIQGKRKEIELLNEQKMVIIHQTVTHGLDPTVPMKDSGIEWIGEIPEYWEIKKLSSITTRIGDGLHGTPEYDDESNFYFVNGNNLSNGKIEFSQTTQCVSEKEYLKYQSPIDNTTLLLSINGTIGNIAYYHGESIILGKSAAYINCDKALSRFFLFYLLQSESIKRYFQLELTGTTIFNLSLASIRSLPTILPPYVEQQNISSYLDIKMNRYDMLVRKIQDNIELIQEYRSHLITDIVTGKLDVCSLAATLPDIKEIPLDEPGEEEPDEDLSDDQEE